MSKQLESRNPEDNALLARYAQHPDATVDQKLDKVCHAQNTWATADVSDRCKHIKALGDALRGHRREYAELMTLEMGKPITQAEGEIDKCAWLCDYYAENAESFLRPEAADSSADRSEVMFRPLGNVLAIMPWNFPFWQAFRFAVPSIAAGNGVVLKHASNVSGCALAIEDVFGEALPEGLLQTVLVSPDRATKLIGDPRIAAVTFTGSTGAGRKVGEAAGAALKKSVLELGGSDPYVVLADADVKDAARICTTARMINSGQSCIAAKRFIVEEEVADDFEAEMLKRFSELSVGSPMESDTDVGPLARPDLATTLANQVSETLLQGARQPLGQNAEPDGCYFAPTILTGVTADMRAFQEELFGPVAPVIRAENADDAIALANFSDFGLGGAIFSADTERAWQIAAEDIETGTVAVNGQVQSDPRLPFGGIRDSGYGRELGAFGIREFVNIKTVSAFG